MNLLAKKKMGWLLATGVLLVGCKEGNLGLELPPDSQQTEIKFIEFSLLATNVYFDSLRTDGQSDLQVGEYTHDVIGTVTASSYTEFRFKNGHIPVDSVRIIRFGDTLALKDITFSTTRLILDADGVVSNDEMVSQHIELYELQDSIFSNVLYFSDRAISKGSLIGEGDIALDLDVVDFANDTLYYPIEIAMEDAFGADLFDDFYENTSAIRPLGFVMEGTSNNGLFSYDILNDTSELIIEMHGVLSDISKKQEYTGSLDTTLTATFRLSPSNNFIHIDRDRASSDFKLAEDRKEIDPSTDFVYLNPLAGVHAKIDLTEFIEFAEQEGNIFILETRLSIELEDNSSTVPNVLFARYFFTRDQGDQIKVNWPGILTNPFGSVMLNDGAYSQAQFSIVTHVYDTLMGYQGSPTLFIQLLYDNAQSELEGVSVENRPGFQPSIAHVKNLLMVSVNPLSLGNAVIRKDGIKLQIFYAQL